MKFSAFFAAVALLGQTTLATSLPRCSPYSHTPCKCPPGTDYSESVTFSVIGANAKDVEALMNDYYECGWLGALPWKTQGPNNRPHVSIRTTEFPTPIGVYNVSEILNEYRVKRDGSFIQKFEQLPSTVPLEYHDGSGSFSGYWVTLEATSIFKYETLVRWSIYACETGHARNFAKFHEIALANATSILESRGVIHGINVDPVSVQEF
ncbi:predicted protein [Uncinocarpus reesii 1704]|uniref:Uncharacterized protein n=1 Tax=Uncinocarpus reesii (strain UAMH 1704) TaxID=336963 RepID=C4JFV6_UNCRE|nr:uncharacterized protein UREG_01036 [Uncinocarpus reesii 1704]EEP76187.1 predicted protein [Uncinocarpus reesii 1704]